MSISFSVQDRVARVTLDRPDRMNAVDAETEKELDAIWSEIEQRDDISCVILTGAGEKAFCAGADLKGGSGSSGVDYWAVGRENGFGGLAWALRQEYLARNADDPIEIEHAAERERKARKRAPTDAEIEDAQIEDARMAQASRPSLVDAP